MNVSGTDQTPQNFLLHINCIMNYSVLSNIIGWFCFNMLNLKNILCFKISYKSFRLNGINKRNSIFMSSSQYKHLSHGTIFFKIWFKNIAKLKARKQFYFVIKQCSIKLHKRNIIHRI